MNDMNSLRNKVKEFSDIVSSIDNNDNTVIQVTVIAKESDIVSIPVEENYREMFTQAIANNCNEETFNRIGMEILMDEDLFARYISFKTIQANNDLESKWILEAMNNALLKKIKQPVTKENAMTINDTTTATETKETTMNTNTQKTKEQLQAELKNVNDLLKKLDPEPTPAKGFDWTGTGKTVGLFVGGAVVGAAGKWAWDHLFG